MKRYILKKDGKLYYKETGEPRKETNRRGVMYYDVRVDGKTRALQADPWSIMKEYNPSEYNIEIDEDVVEDDLFIMHLRYEKEKRMKCGRCGRTDEEYIKYVKSRLWEEVVRYGKEYLFKK